MTDQMPPIHPRIELTLTVANDVFWQSTRESRREE